MEFNRNFMRDRADLQSLLYHLRDKILVCDCNMEPDSCWALFLAELFFETFRSEFGSHMAAPPSEADSSSSNNDVSSDGEEIMDAEADHRMKRHFDLAAGGRQGSRKRPEQLVIDGLDPDEHVRRALNLKHPYLAMETSTYAVNLALSGPNLSAERLIEWRGQVREALKVLASVVEVDDIEIYKNINPTVKAVLEAYLKKNICFMRELNFVTNPRDFAAVTCLVLGLPMLGWAFPAYGLMERKREPTNSYEDWKTDCASRNSILSSRIQGSGDAELDSKSFVKTMAEVDAKVLLGPFYDLTDIPFEFPGIAPRCGIWECHGDAVVPDVRNIDDLLAGEQNSTAGSTHAHRPTDVDALAAQTRAVSHARPGMKLSGWASDFAKAYKQVPGDPSQVGEVVLAQFDPTRGSVSFFVALSQVFGSKTAPVSFSRYPAVFCIMVALLFMLPATHCVDDVIIIEGSDVADSGKLCWDLLMLLCGWKMSASKDQKPSQLFTVIGVSVDLRPFPNGDPSIMVTRRRLQSLETMIRWILVKMWLGSGEAASLSGKLGFTLSATFGRCGRCRIKPILKRAFSRSGPLGNVLVLCLRWWLTFLKMYTPRAIPTSLASLPCVVSYSDGEGGLAGIGAAVWHPHFPRPLAVYSEVPNMIRDQWRVIQQSEKFEDIFLVEALGPLLLLKAFPKVLRNCLWIHFIDNEAAEASLVRGASSSDLGDHVVGLTWSLIQKHHLWAYFDRVSSKANPVDGLSRRCFQGPWERVVQLPFPVDELVAFASLLGVEELRSW